MCTSTVEVAAALPVQPETVIADSTTPLSGIAVGVPLLIVHVPAAAAAADAIAFDAEATEITCGSAASRCASARVSLWFCVAEAEAVAARRPIAARPAARV